MEPHTVAQQWAEAAAAAAAAAAVVAQVLPQRRMATPISPPTLGWALQAPALAPLQSAPLQLILSHVPDDEVCEPPRR